MGDEHIGRAGAGPGVTPPRVPGLVMLRRLGLGGHGDVWLAAELASGERVAVKVHRPPADRASPREAAGLVAGGDEAARLAREIAVLRRIDHPHVVRLRRVVDLPDGGRALVMDLAAGGNLADLVAGRGPLDPPEACTVIVPLARTLGELHGRGLVHGDLAPGNVLFTADGRPMIADLGCAAVLGERPGQVWGSDGYLDPGRTGPADPAHDVNALGALLRFMLTGDPAEGGGTAGPGGDPRAGALLALADLCTAGDPGRRPPPDDVAGTALGATPPAPIRLLRSSGSAAPPAGGPSVSAGGSSAGGPPATARPSAAGRGWTRPADPRGTPTAATILPMTALDLGLDARRGRPAGGSRAAGGTSAGGTAAGRKATGVKAAARVAAPTVSGPAAVTRRRTPAGSGSAASGSKASGSTAEPGRRGRRSGGAPASRRAGRPAQHQRPATGRPATGRPATGRPASDRPRASWRNLLLGAATIVAVTGAAWLLLDALRPGPPPATEVAAAPPDRPSAPAASIAPGRAPASAASAVGEPVDVAVARLARGRAVAFGTGAVQALGAVDEPGSAAMVADAGLIGRLNAQGVRLEGLGFQVSEVRRLPGDGAAATVTATVVTSAHRQVSVRDRAVRASVPASPPRHVVLTLVPGPDHRTWRVREVRADDPSGPAR